MAIFWASTNSKSKYRNHAIELIRNVEIDILTVVGTNIELYLVILPPKIKYRLDFIARNMNSLVSGRELTQTANSQNYVVELITVVKCST